MWIEKQEPSASFTNEFVKLFFLSNIKNNVRYVMKLNELNQTCMFYKGIMIHPLTNVICEYLWVDGHGYLRSKTKVIPHREMRSTLKGNYMPGELIPLKPTLFPAWNYDGSSTWQANSEKNTEVILQPCAVYKDPLRSIPDTQCILILCDTYDTNKKPLESNKRFIANDIFSKKSEEEPWYGLEQEYFIEFEVDANDRKWDSGDGLHYCGFVPFANKEREIVGAHLSACIQAGLQISGVNAEVSNKQWEFQIGPSLGIHAADQLIVARFLLERIAETHGACIIYDPKPADGINGGGCHVNFSTKRMRAENGLTVIYECMNKLEKMHTIHLLHYGNDNDRRLTGTNETSCFNSFSMGIGTRNTSIRIPTQTYEDKCGYFEDRRPASNIDPYSATSILFKTCCLDTGITSKILHP